MRDRRKALGLCIECGKEAAFSRCLKCSLRVAERKRILNDLRRREEIQNSRKDRTIRSVNTTYSKNKDINVEWQTVGNDKS